jgi:hypothetical protein
LRIFRGEKYKQCRAEIMNQPHVARSCLNGTVEPALISLKVV